MALFNERLQLDTTDTYRTSSVLNTIDSRKHSSKISTTLYYFRLNKVYPDL